MTIEELATQGRKRIYVPSAQRVYDNIGSMRNRALANTFSLKNRAHHNQPLTTVAGVVFRDDALALTPNASWYTIEQSHTKVLWILENLSDEPVNFKGMENTIASKVAQVIYIGKEKDLTVKSLEKLTTVTNVSTMQQAVSTALAIGYRGQEVIYSPASGEENKALERAEEYSRTVFDL